MKLNILLLPILFIGCATTRIAGDDKYAMYMDHVTPQMSTARYWIDRTSNPDRILMQQNDIFAKYGTPDGQFDQIAQSGTIDSTLLNRMISIPYQAKLYDGKGNFRDSLIWHSAAANRNKESVKKSGTIRYGIVTGNIEMRTIPTEIRGYQDDDNALFDDLTMTHMITGEQVLILHESSDSQWYLALNRYAPAAWIKKENVALCHNISEWNDAISGDFLLVTADRIRLPMLSADGDDYREIRMGTKLKLIEPSNIDNQRHGKNVYAVQYPERDTCGFLKMATVFIPIGRGVHVGFLPYTKRNVLELAFSCLGDRYGWGGMFGARDCSSFMMDIYRCFGMTFPRNSRQQASLDCKTLNMENMDCKEKYNLLKREATAGSLLYFPGHIFMYLGYYQGRIYTINALSSIAPEGKKIYIQSVAVNTLDEKRITGKTWLETLTQCKVLELSNN